MKNYEKYYRLLLPIVGILCIVIPDKVAQWIPSVLGGIMVLTGITDSVMSIKGKLYLDAYKKRASAVILFIMGICFLLGQDKTTYLMGITWGLLGLQEVNEEFNFHIFLLGLEILAVTVETKNIDELVQKYRNERKYR